MWVPASSGGGSGSSAASALTEAITQTTHGFGAGDVIRYNGTAWAKAEADSAADADVDGIVSAVTDSDNFTITYHGLVTGLSGLTAGDDYYLDPATAGALTATEPTTSGQISAPVLKAISSTSGIFHPLRGLEQPDPATRTLFVKVNDDATALTVAEDLYQHVVTSDLDGWSLTSVIATVTTTAGTTAPSIGIRKGSTEVLSTNVTIDVGELTSETATTAAVIKSDGTETVATGDVLHIDSDAADTSAKGLAVKLVFTSP